MTTVTESGGRQNIYSIEPRPQVDPNYQGYPLEAEKANGRWAMLGFVALLGAYTTTGQIIRHFLNYPFIIMTLKQKDLTAGQQCLDS